MKRFCLLPCLTILVLLGCGVSRPAQASKIVLDIKALIDGRDDLIIQGNDLQWHHFDFAAVGRWEGFNVPTLISTTVDGIPITSDFAWTPDWPLPPPNEIRFEAYSSVFTGLDPGIPSQVTSVSVEVEQDVRTLIDIVQYPSAANAYTTIVEFNDDPFPGPAAAWGRIAFSTGSVPEPSSLFLLGFGILGLAGYAWCRRAEPAMVGGSRM
jgi:PEP-CTERM motif